MKHECGCLAEPADDWDRCDEHVFNACHSVVPIVATANECPPCRLARLRTVSLSPAATPTRRNG